jgi:hypothetical protein
MPHLLIERIRTYPAICPCASRAKGSGFALSRRDTACAYVVEIVDITAALIMLIGSACFLPTFSSDREIFLVGCVTFVIATSAYLALSIFTLCEAIYEKGLESLEACENSLYVAGSLLFNAGTVLYWPEEANWPMTLASRELAPGQYFNWFSPEFEGTVLFIIGSLLFAMASYVNGLSQTKFDTPIRKMFVATTTCYMVGALLFVMGSVAFLPELGCGQRMEELGAILFLFGSLFYLIGGVISLIRTSLQMDDPEYSPLLPHRSPPSALCSPAPQMKQPIAETSSWKGAGVKLEESAASHPC